MGDRITDSQGAEVTVTGMLRVFGLMLAVCILAYSGIALMQESLKWDALDCYLPWRDFVGESLDHGIFPLWNPYQHFGYPIHADMRSVFYIEPLVVGLLGGYSVGLLNVLFLFYLSVAGTGFYLLAGHFTPVHRARLMGGFAYILSGHFVGHGQELSSIIAAALIPWVLHYFIRLQQRGHWADLWKLAFFLFLQLTGGYQALSMMLLYLLIAIFLMELIAKWGDRKALARLFAQNAALTGIVLLTLPMLMVTFYQVAPHIQRFGGITLADAHFMPFSPQCIISWVTPFAVITDTDFYDTDLSMSNGHLGLLMLMGLASALFRKKAKLEHLMLAFGIICLLASFGRYTPVREFLYHHVPLMNLFRMSAHFYYFALLAFLLIGTAELGRMLTGGIPPWKRVLLLSAGTLAITLGIGAYFYLTNTLTYRPLVFLTEYRQQLGQTPRVHHVLIHVVIQSGLLVLLMTAIWFSRRRAKAFSAILMVFLLVEMSVAVRLNAPVTVESGYSPAQIQNLLDQNAQGFPLPDLRTPVGAHRDGPQHMSPLWRNTNILTKTVSFDGFNSFRLDAFERFREDRPRDFAAALSQPVVYFSDSLTDAGNDIIILLRFAPGHIAFSTETAQSRSITLQQTDYLGWQAFVDGEAVAYTLNGIFPTVSVGEGKHRVEFHYRNPALMTAFGVSYGMFALICGAVLCFLLGGDSSRLKYRALLQSTAIMCTLGLAIFLLWSDKSSDTERRQSGYRELIAAARDTTMPMLVLVDAPALFDSLRAALAPKIRPMVMRDPNPSELIALRQWLSNNYRNGTRILQLGQASLPVSSTARELILAYFPMEETVRSGEVTITHFHRDGGPEPLYSISNDLEHPVADWPHDITLTDTTLAFSGTHSWRMDQAMPGSPAIGLILSEKNAQTMVKAVVEMKVYQSSPEANATIYLKIEREGKVIWEATQGFREQSPGPGMWFDVMLVARPTVQLLSADRLQVFAWGGSADPLHVDNLRLRLYAAP